MSDGEYYARVALGIAIVCAINLFPLLVLFVVIRSYAKTLRAFAERKQYRLAYQPDSSVSIPSALQPTINEYERLQFSFLTTALESFPTLKPARKTPTFIYVSQDKIIEASTYMLGRSIQSNFETYFPNGTHLLTYKRRGILDTLYIKLLGSLSKTPKFVIRFSGSNIAAALQSHRQLVERLQESHGSPVRLENLDVIDYYENQVTPSHQWPIMRAGLVTQLSAFSILFGYMGGRAFFRNVTTPPPDTLGTFLVGFAGYVTTGTMIGAAAYMFINLIFVLASKDNVISGISAPFVNEKIE